MKLYRKTLTIVLLAILTLALIPPVFAATITVETDETSYAPDDLVTISGEAQASVLVSIEVNPPVGTRILRVVQADASGAYSTFFRLPVDAIEGIYTVDVSAPEATASTTFTVVETGAPVLAAIGDKTVNELVELTFTATATDDPIDNLTFSLVDAPTGAAITAGGVFTWTPTEAQGPDDHTFKVKVTDEFPYSDEEEITVTVNEVNVAPVLAAIGAKTVNELVELTFTATATDSDLPANTLTFSLVGAQTGALIDSVTGVFTWTPTEAQGPGEYIFDVVVSDGITTDLEGITVTVNEVNGPPAVSVLKLDKEWYHTGDTVSVTLNATYQNENPTVKDIASVWVTSETEYSGKTMALIETGVNTSLFKGTFKLVGETAGTEELLVSDGDLFKVEYEYGPYSEEDDATVDNKVPTVTIIEPLKNSITTDNRTTISVRVEDAHLEYATMFVDDDFRGSILESGTMTYTPELLASWSEGLHTVVVHAEDYAVNVNLTSWSFTVDISKPTCTISTNATGPVKVGQIEITLEFNEGMKKVPAPKITTNATSYLAFTTEKGWTALSNKTYGINATIAGSYNGTALIDVTLAQDLATNVMVAANFTFNIDTVPPTAPGKLNATALTDTIVLEWLASTDFVGMELYKVYRGTATGACDTLLDSVDHPILTFTDTTLLASGKYFYKVKAYDEAGNSATSAEANATFITEQVISYNVSLAKYWNLFSLPLIPDNASIEAVLADVMGNVTIVWGYQDGGWLRYLPAVPSLSTLTTMEDGKGYWILMATNDTLEVNGYELPDPDVVPPVYPVVEGWNLIGFKSVETMLIERYLTTIPTLVRASSVCYGWDATLQEYDLVYIARTPLDAVFEPGQGYWLYLPEDANIAPPLP